MQAASEISREHGLKGNCPESLNLPYAFIRIIY